MQEASASQISLVAGKPSAGSGSSCGIFALRWSHDGRFIASSAMESSRVLWVWDMTSLVCVAQLQNLAAFVDFQWCPRTNQLAAACGSRTVYVWTEEGQSRVEAFCFCFLSFLSLSCDCGGDVRLYGTNGCAHFLQEHPAFMFPSNPSFPPNWAGPSELLQHVSSTTAPHAPQLILPLQSRRSDFSAA